MDANQVCCPNCSKFVATSNFALHESFCMRNISRCTTCGEPVHNQQRAEHEALHSIVDCDCGEQLQLIYIENHKMNDCSWRETNCQFCEISMQFYKIEEHEDYCGNRTDLCQLCHKYVRLKEFGVHIETNCAYPATPVKSPPSVNESRVEMLRASILANCIGRSNSAATIYHEYTRIVGPTSRNLAHELGVSSGDSTALPCEICGTLISLEELLDHQMTCEEENVFDEDVEREYEMIEMELHALQQPKKLSSSRKKKMKRRDSIGKQTHLPSMAMEVDKVSRSRKKCQPPPAKATPPKISSSSATSVSITFMEEDD